MTCFCRILIKITYLLIYLLNRSVINGVWQRGSLFNYLLLIVGEKFDTGSKTTCTVSIATVALTAANVVVTTTIRLLFDGRSTVYQRSLRSQ